ncbi:MAG: S-layer homology domain-containing protein, partial [Candidatus Aquicultor sp.]
IFDLNGFNLNVTNSGGVGLTVTSGSVGYTGAGAFNVTGTSCGVSANGGSASATVTNATATAEGGNGAVAINGGDIVVNGNAQGGYNGVSVANTGSTAVINGNATGIASDSSGARAGSGGSVTINGGTAQGVMYGAYSNGSGSSITINGGDAIGTGPYSHGAHAEIDGTIHVTGNVQGTQYGVVSSNDTSVVVTGNVTVTAELNGWGVHAERGGRIEVGGNVVANGSSLGAYASSHVEINIDGAILASNYIRIFDDIAEAPVDKDGSAGSRTIPTTKAGYYTYSAGTSTVWVKEVAADSDLPTWLEDSTLTASNLGQTGLTLSWAGAQDNAGVVGYRITRDGANPVDVVGTTISITDLTANTTYTFKVEAIDAQGNLSSTGPSITVTTLPQPSSPSSGGSGYNAPPAAPKNLHLVANQGTIELAWDKNTESDLAGYNIYRRVKGKSGDAVKLNSELIKGTSFTDTTVLVGTTYIYYVVAVDTAGGASQKSIEIEAALASVRGEKVFSDVKSDAWYTPFVAELVSKDIIDGYTDGTFRPDAQVTRAEFTKMLALAMGWKIEETTTVPFLDVTPGSWMHSFIETGVSHGALDGYTDGTFKPNNLISREEVAKIIASAMNLPAGTSSLTDINDSWARQFINSCVSAHIISGYPSDNTFRPKNNTTRAEAAAMIARMLKD